MSGWSVTFTLAAVATTTTVTSNADPSVFGQPVTFTAAVATAGLGTPSGNVQFLDGGSNIGAPVALNASGVATLTTSALSVGNHTITAQYAGAATACNGTFNASTGSLSTNPQTVNKADTTTTIGPYVSPIATGIPVTFTANVAPVAPGAGTRTGTVTFFRGGFPVCSNVPVNASGQAICTVTFTIAGNYNITAAYSGDGNFNASSTLSPSVEVVFGPTAANVGLSGRVADGQGRGIGGARVTLQDQQGQIRSAITNPFGFYRFVDVAAGQTYLVSVIHKRYTFDSRTISRHDDLVDLDFVPIPEPRPAELERKDGADHSP
jgi:hypothetical protein